MKLFLFLHCNSWQNLRSSSRGKRRPEWRFHLSRAEKGMFLEVKMTPAQAVELRGMCHPKGNLSLLKKRRLQVCTPPPPQLTACGLLQYRLKQSEMEFANEVNGKVDSHIKRLSWPLLKMLICALITSCQTRGGKGGRLVCWRTAWWLLVCSQSMHD